MRAPVDVVTLGSRFGPRVHPVTGLKSFHRGQDFKAAAGTPIRVVADGVVEARGSSMNTKSGAGHWITVRHSPEMTTHYWHMLAPSRLTVGERVTVGQVPGLVGSTGASTGPHLHFEVRINGVAVDPLAYITATAPAATELNPIIPDEEPEMKPLYYIARDVDAAAAALGIEAGQVWVRNAPGEPLRRLTSGQAADYFTIDHLDYNAPNVFSKPGEWFVAAFADDQVAAAHTALTHPASGAVGEPAAAIASAVQAALADEFAGIPEAVRAELKAAL